MKRSLAIDISDYSLEAILLTDRVSKPKVHGYSRIILDENVIKNGEIKDKEKLSLYFKDLLKKASPKSITDANVIVNVPDSRVFTHIFELPSSLKEDQIRAVLNNEIDNFFPVTVAEVFWDFKVINSKNGQYEVFVAAIYKDIVKDLYEALREAGLRPIVFDLEANAISRTLLSAKEKGKTVILDIGADSSKLSFVTKYGLNFISVIDLAGNKITSTIGRKLKLTKDRAEDLKKNKGLTNEKIKKALEDNLDEFIREIKMNLKFCGERSGMNIEKIVLTGGGAKMPGLMDYLKEKLGKEVVLGEPQINIVSKDVDLKNALYYEVVGLALRGFEKNYEKTDLNLLAGFIKPSKIGKSSLIPIGKPEKEEKKIQEKPEFKIKKAPKERVIRSGGGNTQKYLLIGLGVVFVALAILVVLRWDSIFGTGDKKKEQTTTEAVEETIQEDVLPALGFNMVVDVDVTGANTVSDGVLLGRLAEVHVNGNEMLVTEEISKQTGQSPADAKLVSQANIEQGKEDLVNKLVEENLENIKKENNFDIVVPQIIDFNIKQSTTSVEPGVNADEFQLSIKADPELLLISKAEALNFVKNKTGEEITENQIEGFNYQILSYNRSNGVIKLSIFEEAE